MKKTFLAACLCGMSLWAQAAFPEKPITVVVPYPPGGATDILARKLAGPMGQRLGQPVIVENKAGAGTAIGAAFVAKSAPDGYTWVMSFNGPLAFGPHLYPKLPYQPLRDLQPVMITTSQPNVIAVTANLPVNNMKELVALLKSEPGRYNYASVGNGSSSHLTVEYIKAMTESFAVHIPFNGSPPAVMSVIGGQTQIMASVPTVLAPQVQQGRLKFIAVTSKQRYALLPDVPTVAEQGFKGFEMTQWYGLLAPSKWPRAHLDKLELEAIKATRSKLVGDKLSQDTALAIGNTAAEFAKFIAQEQARWKPVIARAQIRPEGA